jgi:hypothetical protein
MSEYQYYEFLAVDRPLTAGEQAEVRELSTRARITATSFTNEYHWGNFRGDPHLLMARYYDAHLYLANWGTHQIMLRLPRALLSPEVAEQYCVDGHVGVSVASESVVLALASEDDSGEWVEGAEDSLSAIVGVRSELAAGDPRALYLAWLSAYGGWDRDEDAFGEYSEGVSGGDDEDAVEPPVPAGLGSLTAPQRALADFLRVDPDLLAAAAQASPDLPEVKEDLGALAAHIAGLPGGEKDRLLMLVAGDQGARARMELLRGLGPDPGERWDGRPRRTVTKLLDAATELRMERHRRAEAEAAARLALREREREAARQRRLDELAKDPEAAWAEAGKLIGTKVPARYDEAVALLADLRELARHDGQAGEFERRFAALREEHLRKPSLIARFDRAGLAT